MSSKGSMIFLNFLFTIDSIKNVIGFIVCVGIISFICAICNVFRYLVDYSCTNDSANIIAFVCVGLGIFYHIKIWRAPPPPSKSIWDFFIGKPTPAKKHPNVLIRIIYNGALVVGISILLIQCYVCNDLEIYNWLHMMISDFQKQLVGMMSNQSYAR
ncbi:uncharacterized protein LOC105849568 isoform X1 [Hydra vulgaris]|uniref:uncharacterized protein LOC105849568 isoform X1 n=1 Tax=Hydra vulgaris TaxID=6087 RepID=UPI001F5EB8BC|nr:uncharacterized protein LOC105849568 isoform X1 [Hydra vulgaris]